MTGMIVTGHGTFATGLTSGLRLLAGEPEYYEAVDFDPEESLESLKGKLLEALGHLTECEDILILADLAGGSPFNVSVNLKFESKKGIEVIGGVNLPILLDAYMKRAVIEEAGELAKSALEAGKEQTIYYKPETTEGDCGEEDEIEFEE